MRQLLILCIVLSFAALALVIQPVRMFNERAALDALKAELAETKERLRATELKLAAMSARGPAAGISGLGGLPSVEARPVSLPNLAGGSYTLEHDAVVYSPDATLRLPRDLTVSSPTGVMVSDLNQKMVVGDLQIETPTGTLRATEGMVDVYGKISAKKLRVLHPDQRPVQLEGDIIMRQSDSSAKR